MTKQLPFFLLCLISTLSGADVSLTPNEPIVVSNSVNWIQTSVRPGTTTFPFKTIRLEAPGEVNASVLISIMDKDRPEFLDKNLLQRILIGESRPYISSQEQFDEIEIKTITIANGVGFYTSFIDPDLVGAPPKKGNYKTVTPMIISIGSKYLLKATLFCDDLDGNGFKEAFAIASSIKIKE